MPEQRLELRGGIDLELTPAANRGGWSSADKVRFREGRVEKLRGRHRIVQLQKVTGVCRALHWWVDLNSVPRYAIGTNSNLEVWQAGAIYDITPAGLAPGLVTSTPGVPYSLRIWSVDNFGQDLFAIPSGGQVYSWPAIPLVEPPPGTPPPPLDPTMAAAPLPNAPPYNQGGFMTMPQQIFLTYGSSPDGGTLDPMLIRWCSQSAPTSWTASVSNTAGSFRLPRGSRIVTGLQTPLGSFLWTDLDLWVAQFEGFPNVFGFFQLSSNCGAIAQKAVVVAGNITYWLSDHGPFQMDSSGATPLACPVWDYLFLDLDRVNSDKCFAALDFHYTEVYFFFPSASGGTGEIDSFIKYHLVDKIWDTGRLVLTAWTDQNRPGSPVSVGLDGILCEQDETFDNDGAPLLCFAQSAFQDIGDGSQMFFIERFIPDFIWAGNGPPGGNGPQADVTLYFRRWPDDPPSTIGPFTVTRNSTYITLATPNPSEPGVIMRPRGREWAIKIEWNALDSWSRWGVPRLLVQADGRW